MDGETQDPPLGVIGKSLFTNGDLIIYFQGFYGLPWGWSYKPGTADENKKYVIISQGLW